MLNCTLQLFLGISDAATEEFKSVENFCIREDARERETRVEKRNELEMCSSTLKDDIFSCSISCNNT